MSIFGIFNAERKAPFKASRILCRDFTTQRCPCLDTLRLSRRPRETQRARCCLSASRLRCLILSQRSAHRIAWCKDLLPSLTIHKTISKILVHPTCSTTHLGLSEALLEIAGALASSAEIPLGTTCCGTAGDRGLLHPELVHSATRDTLVQIENSGEETCFISANRTCELGMRQTTGKVYAPESN